MHGTCCTPPNPAPHECTAVLLPLWCCCAAATAMLLCCHCCTVYTCRVAWPVTLVVPKHHVHWHICIRLQPRKWPHQPPRGYLGQHPAAAIFQHGSIRRLLGAALGPIPHTPTSVATLYTPQARVVFCCLQQKIGTCIDPFTEPAP